MAICHNVPTRVRTRVRTRVLISSMLLSRYYCNIAIILPVMAYLFNIYMPYGIVHVYVQYYCNTWVRTTKSMTSSSLSLLQFNQYRYSSTYSSTGSMLPVADERPESSFIFHNMSIDATTTINTGYVFTFAVCRGGREDRRFPVTMCIFV